MVQHNAADEERPKGVCSIRWLFGAKRLTTSGFSSSAALSAAGEQTSGKTAPGYSRSAG